MSGLARRLRWLLVPAVALVTLLGAYSCGGGSVVLGAGFCEVSPQPAGCSPGWNVVGRFGPTELDPGGYGLLSLYVFNSGGGEVVGGGPVVVSKLPAGLEAVSELPAGPEAEATEESPGCSGVVEVSCTL